MHPETNDPSLLHQLGLKYVSSNPELSKQYFEQAAVLNYQPSLNNLAIYYLKLNQLDIAYKYLIMAANITVDKYLLNNFGIYYCLKAEYNKAISYLEAALIKYKSNFNIILHYSSIKKIYYLIAMCYIKLGHEKEAKIYYKNASQYGHVEASIKLVDYYARKRNLIKTIKYYVVVLNIIFDKAKFSKSFTSKSKYYEFYISCSLNINIFLTFPYVLNHMHYIDMLIIAQEHLNAENLERLKMLINNSKRMKSMRIGS